MKHAAVTTLGAIALAGAVALPAASPALAAEAPQAQDTVAAQTEDSVTAQSGASSNHVERSRSKQLPKPKELKGYKKAQRWAKQPKVKYIRQRESRGQHRINTGNGYYGAYQFAYGTWKAMGGQKYAKTADKAPKYIQDYVAYKLYKRAGWSPWGG